MPIKELREDRRPADLWFWKDWFSSFEVRCCSLAARGLWIDMLGVMRNADIKGCLTVNGEQIDSKDLAKIAGASEAEVKALLQELEAHKVFSRLDDGTIINRRMYREGDLSRKRAESGRIGAERRWQGDSKTDSKGMAPLAYANVNAISSSELKKEERQPIGYEAKIIAEAVAYLNEKTGKKFNPRRKETAAMISGRISEGRTLEDFKKVIDVKVAKWKGDPKMDDFLRPSTLFRPTHFEEYLNEGLPSRPARVGENKKPESAETRASRDRRNAYEEKLWAEKAGEIERIKKAMLPSKMRDAMDRIELEIRNRVATWVNSGMPEDQTHGGPS